MILNTLPEDKDDESIQEDSTKIKEEMDIIDQHIATLVYELGEEKNNLVLDLEDKFEALTTNNSTHHTDPKLTDDEQEAEMDYVEVIQRFLTCPATPDTTKRNLREELVTQLALDPRITPHSSPLTDTPTGDHYALEKFLKRDMTLTSMSQDDIVM